MVTFSLQRFTKWHWRENIGIGETKRKKKKKRGYGFWVTINDEKKKIPLVGSDMSVGPRRAMDDNLVLHLLLNIFCIKSPTPPLLTKKFIIKKRRRVLSWIHWFFLLIINTFEAWIEGSFFTSQKGMLDYSPIYIPIEN